MRCAQYLLANVRDRRTQTNTATILQSSGAFRLLGIFIGDRDSNIEMKHIFAYPKLCVECNRRVIPDVRLHENNIIAMRVCIGNFLNTYNYSITESAL
ncbi:hypothetical protein [Nostoc sp. 'Peltigera membranacea cyanobiont' N6]|uniref:hypothetical protein n=1 Tax=Nostoc sp. 'Peltigera membranacea cyanobiont' N6 TaxID=1261031 RepID=UPI001C611B37|nr:hypothetical protein [Nostoc sp. 'Peltigera membranacea cyanobiont' N6]